MADNKVPVKLDSRIVPTSTSTPVTLEGATFLLLLYLKLTEQVQLSWLMVFLPLLLVPLLVIVGTALYTTYKVNKVKKEIEKRNKLKQQALEAEHEAWNKAYTGE